VEHAANKTSFSIRNSIKNIIQRLGVRHNELNWMSIHDTVVFFSSDCEHLLEIFVPNFEFWVQSLQNMVLTETGKSLV
jgi:hypothetical protein